MTHSRIAAVLLLAFGVARAADLPAGYSVQYVQDFSNPDSLKDFAFPDPAAWRLTKTGGRNALEQFQQVKLNPPHRSPFNFCLLADKKFGDFVMDVECQQTSKEYGHRDMVFVFGYQEPSKFYYAHIATKGDDHANQIFIVNDAPRTKITESGNAGNDWGGPDVWKTVRIQRGLSDGSIRVFFDDLTKPIMEAKDATFGPGWVGLGTFDDTCRVRKVTVHAPKAEAAGRPSLAPLK